MVRLPSTAPSNPFCFLSKLVRKHPEDSNNPLQIEGLLVIYNPILQLSQTLSDVIKSIDCWGYQGGIESNY